MGIAVLDIGGTAIKAGMVQGDRLSDFREYATDAQKGGKYVMEKAKAILREYQPLDYIGISTAGQVDAKTGTIRYANENIPGYTGMEVKRILEETFKVPVAVENDVNAAAIGEGYYGAGISFSDFLCLTYGTGVGGAIVIEGKVYTGNRFSSGEFGGMIVHASQRNAGSDIFSGCYERYASVTALVKKAREKDPSLDSGRRIFARIYEEAVRKIVDEWIEEVVFGLVSLIHIFNPSCIILGGGIMQQKYILAKIECIIYNNIMKSFRNVTIKQAELGNRAGLLGAAQMVRMRYF